MSDLKPCPMCGDEASFCQWRDTMEPNATWVECPSCGIMTDTFYDPSPDEAKRKAATVWNTRAPDATLFAENEAANLRISELEALAAELAGALERNKKLQEEVHVLEAAHGEVYFYNQDLRAEAERLKAEVALLRKGSK